MGFLHSGTTSIPEIVQSIREVWQGRGIAGGEFTLTSGAASTTVAAPNCGEGNRVLLTPRTANAAAALANVYIPAATVTRGEFVVHHSNNAQTDRTFGYECRG